MAKKGDQKKYRNAGGTDLVFEGVTLHPGDEFLATLDPDHELQLLQGGHIEILQDQSTAADEAQAKVAEEGAGVTVLDPNEDSSTGRVSRRKHS